MSDVNAAFRSVRIEFEGVTYEFGRPNFATEGIFATFLEDRAAAALERQRFKRGDDWWREGMAAFQRDCAAFRYSWGSEVVGAAIRSKTGFKELCFLILTQSTKTLTRAAFDKLYEAREFELVDAYNKVSSPTPTTPPGVAPGEQG